MSSSGSSSSGSSKSSSASAALTCGRCDCDFGSQVSVTFSGWSNRDTPCEDDHNCPEALDGTFYLDYNEAESDPNDQCYWDLTIPRPNCCEYAGGSDDDYFIVATALCLPGTPTEVRWEVIIYLGIGGYGNWEDYSGSCSGGTLSFQFNNGLCCDPPSTCEVSA